jgi:hypothetical protein
MHAMMVFLGGGGEMTYNTIIHHATAHIDFQGVLHLIIDFMWPFLSSGATVVNVHVTILLEGYLICMHHLP